jgi:hypothetical protein
VGGGALVLFELPFLLFPLADLLDDLLELLHGLGSLRGVEQIGPHVH